MPSGIHHLAPTGYRVLILPHLGWGGIANEENICELPSGHGTDNIKELSKSLQCSVYDQVLRSVVSVCGSEGHAFTSGSECASCIAPYPVDEMPEEDAGTSSTIRDVIGAVMMEDEVRKLDGETRMPHFGFELSRIRRRTLEATLRTTLRRLLKDDDVTSDQPSSNSDEEENVDDDHESLATGDADQDLIDYIDRDYDYDDYLEAELYI